jgi:hypothetical protein
MDMQGKKNFCLFNQKITVFIAVTFLIIFAHTYSSDQGPFSLQFSIPEIKIVKSIPKKDRDFAFLIPGNISTYIYNNESVYYADYSRAYYAVTCKKSGWDCMRHYEILANGCIPYFIDLDKCDPRIMALLPKELIKEAMNLPGVSYLKIDHEKFDEVRYFELLQKLLDYTKTYLTTQSMARYLLDTIHYKGKGKILYLSREVSPDYMRECVLMGLKQLYGATVVDYPKIDFLYKSYAGDISRLYGKGFSYTKIIDDLPVDRTNIEQRIRTHEFDLIVYGSVHRGMPFFDLVRATYPTDKVAYICGEDAHVCCFKHLPNFFLREY